MNDYLKELSKDLAIRRRLLIRHISGGKPLDKEKFEKLVNKYREVKQNKSENIEELTSLGKALYRERLYDYAIEVFKRLTAIEPNSVTHYFNLGLAFFMKGEWALCNLKTSPETYKQSANAFRKAYTLGMETSTLFSMLLRAYACAGDEAHFVEFAKKTETIDKKIKDIREHLDFLGPLVAGSKWLEGRILCYSALGKLGEKNYKEAISLVNKAIKDYSGNIDFFAYYLLGLAYDLAGKPNKAIEACIKCKELEPRFSYPYYRIGMTLLYRSKFRSASRYFYCASEMYSRYQKDKAYSYEARARYHYALGMLYWRDGNLSQAYRHFLESKKLKMRTPFKDPLGLKYLASLVKIDERVSKLTLSKDLYELRDRAVDTFEELTKLTRGKFLTTSSASRLLILAKYWFLFALVSVLDPSIREEEEKKLKKLMQQIEEKIDLSAVRRGTYGVHVSKKCYEDLGFVKGIQAVNLAENFILEVKRYPDLESIPKTKGNELIRNLAPFTEICDGKLTRYVAAKLAGEETIIAKLQLLGIEHQQLLELLGKTSEYNKELMKALEGIKDQIKKIPTRELEVKLPQEVSEAKVAKGKTKLKPKVIKPYKEEKKLCDVLIGDGRKKELPCYISITLKETVDLEKQKDEYFIWINEIRGEYLVDGRKLLAEARIRESLCFLLENFGIICSYTKLINEIGSRSEVYKNMSLLRTTNKGILEKYIHLITNEGLKIDGDFKFCIIRRPKD